MPPDPWARARDVAASIQRAVRDATGLSCSIGVTPNKLLSKIASDLEKPGGLTVLREADIPARIWPLPARKINGIGPKASARLEALGIRTIGELAKADPALLIEHFGKSYGAWMHEAAHGRDERAGGHLQRAEIDQPRNDVRRRSASGARPRTALAHLHRPVREGGRRSSSAKATSARR